MTIEVRFTLPEAKAFQLIALAVEKLGVEYREFEIREAPVHDPDKLIFINYRRDDSRDVCGRIYDYLLPVFGKASVFRDLEDIPAGVDFRTVIQSRITTCDVMLVIIGPTWLNEINKARLGDEDDYVRYEIKAGLDRGEENVAVIPVVVNGALMPKEDDLPFGLRSLATRNAVFIDPDPDFRADMKKLVAAIQERFATQAAAPST
jgi:TIR domain-containing protein